MVATHKSANKYISDNNKCENPTYCKIHHVIIINHYIRYSILKKILRIHHLDINLICLSYHHIVTTRKSRNKYDPANEISDNAN